MKTAIKLIRVLCCVLFLIGGNLAAQVKTDKVNTNVALPKKKIVTPKLNKINLEFQNIEFNGEYVVFETQLYKEYLKRKKVSAKYKKLKKYKSGKKSKTNLTKEMLANEKQNIKVYNYKASSGDCGESVSDDLCDNIKNAVRIEIPEEEVPRDCPDEHCLPVNIHSKIQYFIIPKTIEEFKGLFYNSKGVQIGTIGNPYVIKNDSNYLAYPIKLKSTDGDIFVKVYKRTANSKESYSLPVVIKDF